MTYDIDRLMADVFPPDVPCSWPEADRRAFIEAVATIGSLMSDAGARGDLARVKDIERWTHEALAERFGESGPRDVLSMEPAIISRRFVAAMARQEGR